MITFYTVSAVVIIGLFWWAIRNQWRLHTKNSALEEDIRSLTALLADEVNLHRPLQEKKDEYERLIEYLKARHTNVEQRVQELTALLNATTSRAEATDVVISGLKAAVEIEKSNVAKEQAKYAKLIGEKKSSEVRTGQIAEIMAPFLGDFKYNPKFCRFLGNPVDYVIFDTDNNEVVFLEVKSGGSKLSPKQNQIKAIIQAKNVRWDTYRVESKETTVE